MIPCTSSLKPMSDLRSLLFSTKYLHVKTAFVVTQATRSSDETVRAASLGVTDLLTNRFTPHTQASAEFGEVCCKNQKIDI